MNSLTLKEKNFTEFAPLTEISFQSIPRKECVIVLADKTTSGIMYIGKTKNPTKKILGGYLAGYGNKTNKKINSKLLEEGFLERTAISWLPSENPKAAQQELLNIYKKEHGDYPDWNIKNPEKTQLKPRTQQTTKPVRAKPARKTAGNKA
ncbi:MAG: hypothetical protein FWG55_05390 [Candidatus Bathyarchaeota archaeon]|nr:hypothetical protein [Candidatus Termiticorpusculum sp.]